MDPDMENEETQLLAETFFQQQEAFMQQLDQMDADSDDETSRTNAMLQLFTGKVPRDLKPRVVLFRRYTWRFREEGHEQMICDYFLNRSVYSDQDFQRCYRMPQHLVMRVIGELCRVNPKFNYQFDAQNIHGHSTEQNVTATLRILGYGVPADACDEYICMAKTTSYDNLKMFCETVVNHFGPRFLKQPTQDDVNRLLAENRERGFLGMLGSLDCMHWVWHGCQYPWQGQYKGHYTNQPWFWKRHLLMIVGYDTLFIGLLSCNNDMNIFHKSPLFEDLKYGNTPAANFTINGNHYTWGIFWRTEFIQRGQI